MIKNYPDVLSQSLPIGNRSYGDLNITPPEAFSAVRKGDDFFDLVDTMSIDSQITAALGLRKRRALTSSSHQADGDTDAVDLVSRVLERLTWVHDIEDGFKSLEYGFCVQEIIWEIVDGEWLIDSIELRDPRNFQYKFNEITGQLVLYYRSGASWIAAPERKFIVHTRQATRENPYGKSALEACFPEWAAKWLTLQYLARIGEKYLVPSVVALTDTNDMDELNKISEKLSWLENSMGVALSGVRDLIQLKATSESKALKDDIEYYNSCISKALTSQTLALDAGDRGARSLGEVHEENLDAICAMDMDAVMYKFNRTLLQWICELNGIKGHCKFPTNGIDHIIARRRQKGMGQEDYLLSV
jgi:phage gp29-like protein